jgi:uncharacterized protein
VDASDLPLLELFTKLQDAGFPLGIDEYKLVLKSLQGGFGIRDKHSLKRLCQTLWVKSAEEKALFELHFEKVIGGDEGVTPYLKQSVKSFHNYQNTKIYSYAILFFSAIVIIFFTRFSFIEIKQIKNQTQPSLQNKETVVVNPIFFVFILIGTSIPLYIFYRQRLKRNTEKSIAHKKSLLEENQNPSKFTKPLKSTQIIQDEIPVVQAVLQPITSHQEILEHRFILSTNVFPITKRQIKYNWRYLRQMIREGQMVELDVEATVKQIERQGLLLNPVFVPRLINRVEILLLIDQDGSMAPFHALSSLFKETLLDGNRLSKVSIYYFHNCPSDYLYNDPSHQKAELVCNIVNFFCSERTKVLIFSDAGAARGGYSEERYNLTREFISLLQKRMRYIAWLNPVPKQRWLGTTAGKIALSVPMFEVNRRGMLNAINVMRGKKYEPN